MNAKRRTALQRMDALVWWTKASDKVQHDMADHRDEGQHQHQPTRWLPLIPMALGAALIFAAPAYPLPLALSSGVALVSVMASSIAMAGPLGKPSSEDDEREAALRKNAFFFCLAFLAIFNIVAGPVVLLTAALQEWTVERAIGVAFALFVGNMTWFASLPTLYASWKLPKLSESEW
jgi:hypothetical protein